MEVKILTHLCRICLSDNILLPIFDTNSNEQICDKIMACAAVHVALGDPLPNQICKQCLRALEISHLFKTKCEQMDRQLRSIIKDQTSLLSQSNNTPIKYSAVQINIEPSQTPLFNDLGNINLSPKINTSETALITPPKLAKDASTDDESKVASAIFVDNELIQHEAENFTACENSKDGLSLNGEIHPIYTFSNLSKDLITVSSTEIDKNYIEESNTSIENGMQESFKQEHQELETSIEGNEEMEHIEDETQSSFDESTDKGNQSNGDIVVYFDNDDFHLGEECEVVADEIRHSPSPEVPSPSPTEEDVPTKDPAKNQIVPKGRYVIIKSVIKPQNIHYVTMDSFRNKDNSKLIPIKQVENVIKKEHVEIKAEIPEPAAYVETETFESEDVENEKPPTPKPNSEEKKMAAKDDIKYKGRGRPRKTDKYKPPHGVSYLKSGRKNVPVFVRTRKTKRTRYSYLKEIDDKKSSNSNVYTKSLPIIKRARVEKIVPPKRFEEKKTEPNRKLSTNMLLSDKQFNKLNDPQKQVLYQRLKLQNFRPTSKKDICERGIPEPLYVVSPKLSEESEGDENEMSDEPFHSDDKKQRTTSISDDLAIIKSSNNLEMYKNQTIDQDLKLINGSSYSAAEFPPNATEKMESTTTPAKTGRHTAIKSKRPQKRNYLQTNYSDPQKIEIELKMVPRKSERQRSPKKIFPEIDIFASPKKKVIEIPVSENSEEKPEDGEYEIEKNEQNQNKFKIKLRQNSTKSTTEEENEEDTILSDYYNEIEVETENDEDYCEDDNLDESKYQSNNSAVVRKILEKERVKLDYGAGLSCNVCNKSFPYRSHLIRHVRTHTGLKPYTCEYCKKSYTSSSSLSIHVKNHIGDHPYSCEVCGRGFVQPSVLKRHMLSHTGEHPFQCEICFKTFVHDSSLKTHLKMHTIKEPQHKCEICEKKFRYLSTLTCHLKTHSGIKPFTCPECRKAFYRRSLLTRHMRSHTKERPYKCKLCKARFAYSGGLASHKKLHTGIRPYECELCDFTFFRSSHLKNHMQKIHNNGVLLSCQKCNMNFDSKPLFKKHLSLHIKGEPQLAPN